MKAALSIAVLLLIAVAIVVGVIANRQPQSPPSVASPSTPVQPPPSAAAPSQPTLTPYPFAQYDTIPAGFVGTAACAKCHPARHASYLASDHSRSLSLVDLADEQVPATLDHPPSKRSYEVHSAGGQLHHREIRHFDGGNRITVNDLPVSYVMGSGAFAKGYLLTDGKHLLQSPVTWYVGADDYGIAPGYDQPHPPGFTRVITDECLYCHAGLVSRRDQNDQLPVLHELAIGCERCHGPGAAHAQLYRDVADGNMDPATIGKDTLIVHPADLPRRLAESICGQCHLHGDTLVNVDGREPWDFVPGEDFAHVRLHYKHDTPAALTRVFTGHFDQMWQSECYLQSDTLTCTSCHDPHRGQAPTDLVDYRRQQCNRCHDEQGCDLPLETRHRRDNNCVACHMPTIDSDVPHTSTTNHWIAVYQDGRPRGAVDQSDAVLRRVETDPDLPADQLARLDLLASAYRVLDLAGKGDLEPLRTFDQQSALTDLLLGDASDAEIHVLLARLARQQAEITPETAANQKTLDALWQRADQHAVAALQLETQPTSLRQAALEVLGNQRMRDGDYAAAVQAFGELVGRRRSAVDWYNLGLSLARQQRLPDAEAALRQAIGIDGTYAAAYRSLSILYRAIDPTTANQLAVLAEQLAK